MIRARTNDEPRRAIFVYSRCEVRLVMNNTLPAMIHVGSYAAILLCRLKRLSFRFSSLRPSQKCQDPIFQLLECIYWCGTVYRMVAAHHLPHSILPKSGPPLISRRGEGECFNSRVIVVAGEYHGEQQWLACA